MQNLVAVNDSIANVAKWYHHLSANESLNKNSLVSPVRLFETNQKTVHQIYLNHVGIGNADFSATDSATLYSIGHECVGYGGPAVIEAQGLYNLINPNENFDNVPCNLGNRWGFDNETAVNNDVFVYPNPASDLLNVYLPLDKSFTDFSISVYDLLGNEIYKLKNQKSNSHVLMLKTEGLINGMYFLKIASSDFAYNNSIKFQIIK